LKTGGSSHYNFSEVELNGLAYSYLYGGLPSESIAVFRLNAEMYPNSWACWDGLGEALEQTGSKKEALQCFQRVLEINPGNKSATEAVKRLQG
jgi:D-alanyl-D-alanine carboxypeptidase